MSTRYTPIPVESDNEDDIAEPAPMSEDDTRTERTRSTDRSNFFHEHDTNDEDPDEDPPSTDNREPSLIPNSRPFGQRPPRQTARIRVATPSSQHWTTSQSSAPPSSSNTQATHATPGFHIWERTLRTLTRWRDSQQYTPAPQFENSAAIRQEFLLDTTPIIVDKLVRHEEKLDIIEDTVMDLPGAESFGEMQYQIDNADNNIAYVNGEVQSLKKQVESMAQELKDMRFDVKGIDHHMEECYKMNAMACGIMGDQARLIRKGDKK